MKKANLNLTIALCGLAFLFSSCYANMHVVGAGGKGNCKQVGQFDAKKKQWYLFWGLLPLNTIDTRQLAGGADNYTIRTTFSFGDGLIAIPGAYLLGLSTRTVRVSKGDK